MANTTNFGWETPDDTDLVKDGAAAMRTLGNSIDASFVDLKGGTTGQVLSKASNTDLDFTWVAQDDSNAIQNAIVDAKGDLISATAADTPARLAVGTNGQFLAANSATATGLEWQTINAGGMTQLATGTLSGSQVDISSISGTYRHLQLQIKQLDPTDDGGVLRVRVNDDSSASYRTIQSFSVSNQGFSSANYDIGDVNDNGTNQGFVVMNWYDYANTTTWKTGDFLWVGNNSTSPGNFGLYNGYTIYNQTGAITKINLFLSPGGNFAGGTYILYGVK